MLHENISLRLLSGVVFLSSCSTNSISDNFSDGTKLVSILAEGKLSHEFAYNVNGRISKQTFYGIPGKKISEINYLYDPTDKLIKTEYYTDVSSSTTAQNLVCGYTVFVYGADEKPIEEIAYTKKDAAYEFASKTIPTYNAAGRTVSRYYFP
jgi:glycine/serine hydroxymethyltransferase